MDAWFNSTYWKMYDDLRVAEDRHSARAVKVVTFNEPLLRTDGRGHIVFPECLIIESFLQMVAVMIMAQEKDTVGAAALIKVISARFYRTPRLGDRVLYETKIRRRNRELLVIDGTATLDSDASPVAEAQLLQGLILKSRELSSLFPTPTAVEAGS